MTYINRDPFARTELTRRRLYTDRDCDWCGQIKTTPKGYRYLYRYGTATDDGRYHEHKGSFCSKDCHDDYHQR